MWELDKHHLLGSVKPGLGFSVKEEIQKRFSEVEAIVVGVIAPRIERKHLLDLHRDSNMGLRCSFIVPLATD